MKNVIVLLKREYPYQEEFVKRLKNALYSVHVVLLNDDEVDSDAKKHIENGDKKHVFIITDNSAGIELARKYDIGYAFYENENNKKLECPDAECVLMGFEELGADYVLKMYQRKNNIPWTIAQTENLIIRESKADDIESFYEIYDDEKIAKFCQNLDVDRADGRAFLESYIENMYRVYGFGLWSIVRKSDNKIIGRAGIFVREGFDGIELGYLIDRNERNRGYALECVKAILQVAFEDYYCEKLRCIIDNENIESISLAKKLGFNLIDEYEVEQRVQRIYEIVYKKFTNI